MPRVYTKTKSTRGKAYFCDTCRKQIEPGEKYLEWGFRFGGSYRRHAEHGYPKPSELTQSKMASVLSAIEEAEGTIGGATELSEVTDALQSVADAAREVAEEYREAVSAMNMEGSGNENEQRADDLESFADDLESSISDVESKESDVEDKLEELKAAKLQELADEAALEEESEEPKLSEEDEEELRKQALEEVMEEARSEAEDALSNCPA